MSRRVKVVLSMRGKKTSGWVVEWKKTFPCWTNSRLACSSSHKVQSGCNAHAYDLATYCSTLQNYADIWIWKKSQRSSKRKMTQQSALREKVLRKYRAWSHCNALLPLSFLLLIHILDNMVKMAATNDLKSQILTNHSNHMSSEENAVINHPTDGSGLDIWHKSSKMRQGEGHSCRQWWCAEVTKIPFVSRRK